MVLRKTQPKPTKRYAPTRDHRPSDSVAEIRSATAISQVAKASDHLTGTRASRKFKMRIPTSCPRANPMEMKPPSETGMRRSVRMESSSGPSEMATTPTMNMVGKRDQRWSGVSSVCCPGIFTTAPPAQRRASRSPPVAPRSFRKVAPDPPLTARARRGMRGIRSSCRMGGPNRRPRGPYPWPHGCS